jgi:hypothetical protein
VTTLTARNNGQYDSFSPKFPFIATRLAFSTIVETNGFRHFIDRHIPSGKFEECNAAQELCFKK